MTTAGALGSREHRLDGLAKATGTARYTADFTPAGMLHVRYVSSPYAHAIVRRVDTAAALRVPGVVAVLAGADATGIRVGRRLQDWPVLAWDRARFIGDRVAAVAAETEDAAEEGASAVVVDYEELQAVFSAEAALEPDASILHPDAASYRFLGGTRLPISHPNLQGEVTVRKGLATDEATFDALFASAENVVTTHVTTGRQHQGAIETHAATASVDADGRIHLRTTNKSPFLLRGQMAAALGVAPETIDIVSEYIGGDFGSKGLSIDEYPCTLLARATGRPCRAVAPFSEDLTAYAPRHGASITLRSVVDQRGRILAHDADLLYDGGAYAAAKPIPPLIPPGGFDALGAYDIPHVRIRVRSVYTNSVPGGHMRCPGELQSVFAGESHMDEIAAARGLDAVSVRRLNLVGAGSTTALGEEIHDPTADVVLDALERNLPAEGPGRRVGIALAGRRAEGGQMSIAAVIAADGDVEMVTALPDQGAGAHTMIARIAAATLSIPAERVRVAHRSTADAPADIGVGASRVTFLAGRATEDASGRLRAALEAIASAAAGQPLHLRGGTFVDEGGRSVSSWESVTLRPEVRGLSVVGTFNSTALLHEGDGPEPADFSFAGMAVAVSVDRETGVWRVEEAVFVGDTGTIVNPLSHAGQIEGGFAQGLGAAMMEELVFGDGQIATASLADYCLPASTDVPALRSVVISDHPGPGAFGTKMAGELSPSVVAPAVANAIARATGVRPDHIPITPPRLLAALLAAGNGRDGA